jgi:hypothetical protein
MTAQHTVELSLACARLLHGRLVTTDISFKCFLGLQQGSGEPKLTEFACVLHAWVSTENVLCCAVAHARSIVLADLQAFGLP